MRKLLRSFFLIGAALLMLIPIQPVQPVQPVHQVQAIGFYEEYYTVRYACLVGQ